MTTDLQARNRASQYETAVMRAGQGCVVSTEPRRVGNVTLFEIDWPADKPWLLVDKLRALADRIEEATR